MDLGKIHDLCESIIELNKQRYTIVKNEVEDIIENNIKDARYIEHELDELLEIIASSDIEGTVQIFKKLCRYYYNIDKEATIDYINFYIEDRKREEDLER